MKNRTSVTAVYLLAALGLSGCAAKPPATELTQAQRIAKSAIIVDGHIDVPYRVNKHWVDVTQATADGDFDYPRAVQGGLNAPFMSIYVPASLDNSKGSIQLANTLIDTVEAIVARAPDKFAIATSVADVRKQFTQGLISLPLGMENGSPIQGDLANLQHFYDRGIRYITLAHSQSNHISDSSYDIRKRWQGLSPFGKTLIKQMNNLGILIDISHVSDQAFYQVIELSRAPVIASHSSIRFFTPGWERNMDQAMLNALGANGGVIMINFGSGFVSPEARQWWDRLVALREQWAVKFGQTSPETLALEAEYRQTNPYPFADLETVLDHIDLVKATIGAEHIGIGSDFDGVGNTLPTQLKDVSTYPNLIQGLLDRGYSENEITGILGLNLLRVWEQVEQLAAPVAKTVSD